ncbi:PREDICTED: uncharacterized protein LOC105458952, partial [Wasmannia auropunctata]|uniref:uncharacterized protein LOC105458952 n=1 Tax=Wasmannia auropunctata TaxID=64793 RepID=UPI0005ED7317
MTAIMSRNDDVAYAMTPFKFLTLPLGVWPLQEYNALAFIRSFVCTVSLTAWIIIIFFEVNFGGGDVYTKIDGLLLMMCTILSVIKILAFRLYADNMIRNFSSAVKDYLAIDNENMRKIMRHHAFMARVMCYSVLSFAYTAPVFFLVAVLIAGGDEDIQVNSNTSIKNPAEDLPVPLTWTLGSYHLSTSLYFVITIVQYIILTLNCNGNVGNKMIINTEETY